MDAVTQKDRQSVAMVDHVQAVRLLCSEVRTTKGWAVKGKDYGQEAAEFTLARKAATDVRRPYRKPTQVGEERILRRAGEPLLRNSAK